VAERKEHQARVDHQLLAELVGGQGVEQIDGVVPRRGVRPTGRAADDGSSVGDVGVDDEPDVVVELTGQHDSGPTEQEVVRRIVPRGSVVLLDAVLRLNQGADVDPPLVTE